MMLEGEFYRDAGVAFGERSAVSLLQRDTGDWAGMQVFSCCSTGRSLTLVRKVETNKYALGNAKCMSQYIWPTLCVCVTNANGTLCMSFSSCHVAPFSTSYCQRMWQVILGFLLLSNVKDFLIWWSTQVALHEGACPQRVELPAYPPVVSELFGRLYLEQNVWSIYCVGVSCHSRV